MVLLLHRPVLLNALLVAALLGWAAGPACAKGYLADFGGQVTVERDGAVMQPSTGMALRAGDRLQTMEEGWLLVGYTERAALHLAGRARVLLLPRLEESAPLRAQLDAGVVRLATETPFELLAPEAKVSAEWANLVLKSGGGDAGVGVIEGEATITHPDGAIQGSWTVDTGLFRALSARQAPGPAIEIPNQWLAGIGPELTPCGCGDVLTHLLPDPAAGGVEEEQRKKAIIPPTLHSLPLDPMMQRDRPLSRPMVVPR